MDETLVTISEASGILGVSEVALRQWTDEGRIKAFVTPGGHRRYSKTELKKFMNSHPKAVGVKDLIAELEATSKLHGEIGRTSLSTKDWYSCLNKEEKFGLAHLGRNMLDVIIRYINEPAKRERTLERACEVGRGFGETLASLGLPLTDSVEAFILHRDPIMKAIAHLMKKREAHSSRVAASIPLVARVMDEALVSLVATHQQHRQFPNVEKEYKSL
ncbi:MAG TPA: helix-turn-helix domain-containing protein [Dehalococcoidia bacterium]|nr:helix-turn-helix domain-containing protein [Dehalococcoidia bacterium]